MKKKKLRISEPPKPGPGEVFMPGVGMIQIRSWFMKSYYYLVTIPQPSDIEYRIPLFDDHIGDLEWTNMPRPRMLAEDDKAVVYKVSLVVKPDRETRIFDVIEALQYGHLTISQGREESVSEQSSFADKRLAEKPGKLEDFVSEPLWFFPVNIYGEIASRERDLVAHLLLEREIPKKDAMTDQERRAFSKAITGLDIPLDIGTSDKIWGQVKLDRALYGSPQFGLYVVLHTVTSRLMKE